MKKRLPSWHAGMAKRANMNRKQWIILCAIVLLGGTIWFINQHVEPGSKTATSDQFKTAAKKPSFYFTCPMHPQIHQDHEGECPICHMKLVRVVTEPNQAASQSDQRA